MKVYVVAIAHDPSAVPKRGTWEGNPPDPVLGVWSSADRALAQLRNVWRDARLVDVDEDVTWVFHSPATGQFIVIAEERVDSYSVLGEVVHDWALTNKAQA